ANLDTVFVRLAGADYQVHGIRFNPVPLMTETNAEKSAKKFAEVAARHSEMLSGFETIGYDSPGYGYGDKDEKGIPKLKKLIGQLATTYDVPYLVDGAGGIPGMGFSLEDVGADVMVWSMDKVVRAPTSGLIVGKEELMVPIRKALGLGGQRYGEVSSHGKALFSCCDPGRDTVIGMLAVLKTIRDEPERITRPIDEFHDIIVEEFASLKPRRFRDKLIITKSYAMGKTEINYEQTWCDDGFGIPIFTLDDLVANTNPIMSAQQAMGIYPATLYAGNMR
ncbi:unnamed protein product, partial [marine sediment metagenome]